MSYTTADFLESVKSRGMIPTSQDTFSDTNLLNLASEELRLHLTSHLMSTREEYLVAYKDYTPDGKEYRVPTRAIGQKLRDVVLANGADDESGVPRIDPSAQEFYGRLAFFLRGNKVVFTATPTDTVRLYYHRRPSKLIKTTEAARITSIDSGNLQVEVSSLPATILTTTPVDIVRGTPGYDILSMDATISNISGTTLTFSSLPDELAEGDYIALAGESPVVQLPEELIPILAQRTVVKVLEALGDREGLAASQAKLMEMERDSLQLIEPRVDGENQKIVNHQSRLRRGYPARHNR